MFVAILMIGSLVALVALSGDVSYSNDHYLVKEMGLPL